MQNIKSITAIFFNQFSLMKSYAHNKARWYLKSMSTPLAKTFNNHFPPYSSEVGTSRIQMNGHWKNSTWNTQEKPQTLENIGISIFLNLFKAFLLRIDFHSKHSNHQGWICAYHDPKRRSSRRQNTHRLLRYDDHHRPWFSIRHERAHEETIS